MRKLELAVEGFTFSAFGTRPRDRARRRSASSTRASDRLFVRELSGSSRASCRRPRARVYPSGSPDGRHVAYVERGQALDGRRRRGQPSEVGAVPADLAGSAGTAWSEQRPDRRRPERQGRALRDPGQRRRGPGPRPARSRAGSRLPRGERAARRPRLPVHRASARGLDTDRARSRTGRGACRCSFPGRACARSVYSPTGHILYRPRVHQPGLWAIGFSLETLVVSARRSASSSAARRRALATDARRARRASETPSELVWLGRDAAVEKAGRSTWARQRRRRKALLPLALSRRWTARGGRHPAAGPRRPLGGDLARGSTSRLIVRRGPTRQGLVCTLDGHVIFTLAPGGLALDLWRATTIGGAPAAALEFDGIQNPLAVSLDGRSPAVAQGAEAVALPLRVPARRHARGQALPPADAREDAIDASSSPAGASSRTSRTRSGCSEVDVPADSRGRGPGPAGVDGRLAPRRLVACGWLRSCPPPRELDHGRRGPRRGARA